jgi:Arc/MetJ family transcription regulator
VATNLHLDDALVERARKAGRHRSKRDAVTAALEAYVRHLRSLRILALEGKVDFDPSWSSRAARRDRSDRVAE